MSEQDEQGLGPQELARRLEVLRADEAAQETEAQTPPPAAAAPPHEAPAPADEPQADTAPAEGYDPQRQAWLKTYSLGTPAALHELSLQDAAAHPVTAALSDGAARAAQDAGYRPAAAPELIDVRRNGDKSDLTYAVPTDAR